MVQPTVSASIAASLLNYAVVRGADRTELIKKAGIIKYKLDNPDDRLPFELYVNLMRTAQSLVNDPALALHHSEEVGMSEISVVGLIMEASRTMGEAFIQLQRYSRLAAEIENNSEGPQFTLTQANHKLYLVDLRCDKYNFPELAEGAFVRLVCGPRRFLSQPHVLSVHLRRSAPAYRDEYERIFQCPVYFDAKWNAIELHPDITGWEVAQNPTYVFGVLTKHADRLLRDLEATKTVRGKVESQILSLLHQGDVGADSIAAAMGFSRQTLFRKLKEEGTTYAAVLNELRRRLAKDYLIAKKTSVNETAYLVGFSDAAAFSRAFKRWTGLSPREFKDNGELWKDD